MKKETKEKSIEHIGIGISKIIGNYTDYVLLINACDVASKRYETMENPIVLSTTQNIPEPLRLDSFEMDVQFTKEELVNEYSSDILIKIFENYLIRSISVVDGILEDLFEIILKCEDNLAESEIEKSISNAWRNDNLKNYLTNPNGLNLKKPDGMNMSFDETFMRYLELRIIRHAIIHTNGILTEKDYNRLKEFEEKTPVERKNMALINSQLIDHNKKIILSLNKMLAIRQYLDRFLMYFYNSFQQEVTE
ncbi:hypothetical protein ACFSX9_15505 [Flavobacterium ardleyense]|uniref:RiboL-PSP-HEPN domain-containing protein n=1 Tax=Flavobacterium ardleyense TaxID=2038737 RepID=A0ABW5ZCD6_9FLAO